MIREHWLSVVVIVSGVVLFFLLLARLAGDI